MDTIIFDTKIQSKTFLPDTCKISGIFTIESDKDVLFKFTEVSAVNLGNDKYLITNYFVDGETDNICVEIDVYTKIGEDFE